MISKNSVFLLVFTFVLAASAPALAEDAGDSDDAYVNQPNFDEGVVTTEAGRPGEPGRSSDGSAPAGPVEPPKVKVDVLPSCAVLDIEESGPPLQNCTPRQCANGEPEYVRLTEDLVQGGSSPEFFCGAPDSDPGTLAVEEFYTNTVTVSVPTIAPKTTTLANFPNIFWSDVTTYVEGTGITVADVRLKFLPVSYVWNFGDGETMTLKEPGKPYDPELVKVTQDADKYYDNIHRYKKLGTFDVTLTVVFNGQYSVNGGTWIDIAGSVQATSPPHPLTVRQARGELIKPGN